VQLAPPTIKPSTSDKGKRGESVQLPLSGASRVREGTDKAGARCQVWDCTFHPEALTRARKNPRFRHVVVEAALDELEKVVKTKVIRAYKVPSLKFKATPELPDKPAVTVRRECCMLQAVTSGQRRH
jgi:PIH1 N-terminal domain